MVKLNFTGMADKLENRTKGMKKKSYSSLLLMFSFFMLVFSCPVKQLLKNSFDAQASHLPRSNSQHNYSSSCTVLPQPELSQQAEFSANPNVDLLLPVVQTYSATFREVSSHKKEVPLSSGPGSLPLYLSYRNLRI